MRLKRVILIGVLIFVIGIAGFFLFSRFSGPSLSPSGADVDVDSALLKTVIKSGGIYEGQLKITNIKDYGRHFDVSFIGVEDFASVNPASFDLASEETLYINISFSNKNDLDEGVYVGSLNILSEESSRQLPVILEIESDDVLFDANLALYPSDISLGDDVSAEVKIFDLSQIGTSNVEIEYFIKDFSNELIFSEKENIVVNNQILKTKAIVLPESIKEGDYVFGVVLKYKNSIGTTSTFFRIGEYIKSSSSGFFDNNILMLVIIFVFVILILLIFVFYSMYSRDKLLEELKKQYRYELRRQDRLLGRREVVVEKELETKEEKRVSKKLFKKVRKERKREIGRIQKERVRTLKKLKKGGKKGEMKSMISKWKKKGYDTGVLDRKIKVPTARGIKGMISKWKKKGYDTSVLDKSQ